MWEEEEPQSLPYLDCAEFGVFNTQKGKRHIGFMETSDQQWPVIRFWKGRDEFLKMAPVEGITKDDLGEVGGRWACPMRVYYETNESGYKNAVSFELLTVEGEA